MLLILLLQLATSCLLFQILIPTENSELLLAETRALVSGGAVIPGLFKGLVHIIKYPGKNLSYHKDFALKVLKS